VDERGTGAVRNQGRRKGSFLVTVTAAVILAVAAAMVVIAVRWHQQEAFAGRRPSGIPANVPTGTINLMGLSPVPATAAPGFTLTDQDGRTLPLSRLRGKVVVLEFIDPHCTDICPLVSQEFVDAYHDLGRTAGGVVFAGVNVNRYFNRVPDVLAYSRDHQLSTIPDWHFFTGSAAVLQAAWRDYNIEVEAPNPDADIVHTSIIYFIGPGGTERYVATPVADRTSNGTSYLPGGQLAAWGRGIALVAKTLTS
jgi:cytochrome oxidase Cu insertion factor (SCO1/SenC/PrrC family)